jgi:hypothetical protein
VHKSTGLTDVTDAVRRSEVQRSGSLAVMPRTHVDNDRPRAYLRVKCCQNHCLHTRHRRCQRYEGRSNRTKHQHVDVLSLCLTFFSLRMQVMAFLSSGIL